MISKDGFKCPVCGFDALDEPPYDKHGCSSFDICPSCGTQFGYHDFTKSHLELRKKWVDSGMNWWSRTNPPSEWNAIQQLRKAGF